ncbi:hypothetical protein BMT55_03465 [Listeria newyorkensis]|uniref:glutamate decarboxylase n=1 Tax=Listeria newyorkensis TaxID=1497681 RepID=A0ABX4XPQ8_9LIST|nr:MULTISPECIES: pyridoxal-dependent decarboxylase [Listeria]KMT62302.1 glutamate decarboxylase [Listeria newyorkensis]PNP93839.1 hypothetical protein BMT55_03465 [Listeria newyorkensis]RQW67342.1 hypothetical protein DUK53_06180 [Listeria sp. SHR_NRA_18]WAO22461.1 pyridoxal-dependent decarboxylase [Listeria newyorkensis]SQC50882.1 Glutamate decarboxylase [Listeria newyorkensis]
MALLGGNKKDSKHDGIGLFYGEGLSEQSLPRYVIPADTIDENADQRDEFIGTSTVGSSEACMLGGMAALFRWKQQARNLGLDMSKRPNMIISSAYQVVWEKFGVYWDIELRKVTVTKECLALDPDKAIALIDDYTICVVGIMVLTYTGRYDDIKALDAAITTYDKTSKVKVYIHVDAASGSLYTPFMEAELEWDFHLDNVKSINTSGHKYGLVYPGVGWVVWKDKAWLSIFNVQPFSSSLGP